MLIILTFHQMLKILNMISQSRGWNSNVIKINDLPNVYPSSTSHFDFANVWKDDFSKKYMKKKSSIFDSHISTDKFIKSAIKSDKISKNK